MVKSKELVAYCDELLEIERFSDYCPNGLQIQGSDTIQRIVCGVTASQELIDEAVKLEADCLLVHHGFFWKGETRTLTGIKYRRIKSLLCHDINLLAYHLPLDAHKTLGNNVQLAQKLGLKIESFFGDNDIALLGTVNRQSGETFARHLSQVLERQALHIPSERMLKKVALCTGAAQSYIEQAVAVDADAFISGEVSENTWHLARENNIHYFAAGHHVTERYGVQALGEHLAQQFDLEYVFIDKYNPI